MNAFLSTKKFYSSLKEKKKNGFHSLYLNPLGKANNKLFFINNIYPGVKFKYEILIFNNFHQFDC